MYGEDERVVCAYIAHAAVRSCSLNNSAREQWLAFFSFFKNPSRHKPLYAALVHSLGRSGRRRNGGRGVYCRVARSFLFDQLFEGDVFSATVAALRCLC